MSWTSDAVVGYLPCLSIQFGCTLSIHKFWQIVSVDRDPRQCQQMIGEFVSITCMGKQHSLILIVHWSPVKHTRRQRWRHHELLYHIVYSALLASCACDGITFCVVLFCNLIGSTKFWEVMVDRKCTETLPGHFSDFSGRAWGRDWSWGGNTNQIHGS